MVNAFVTARRGTCFLSIRIARRTCDLWRIRAYTIDAVTKRDPRRLHPDVAFDWPKITHGSHRGPQIYRRSAPENRKNVLVSDPQPQTMTQLRVESLSVVVDANWTTPDPLSVSDLMDTVEHLHKP